MTTNGGSSRSRNEFRFSVWFLAVVLGMSEIAAPAVVDAQRDTMPRRALDGAIRVPYDQERTARFDKEDVSLRADRESEIEQVARRLALVYWQIPEYHDEQSFPLPDNTFGPYAYLFASPYIGSFTRVSQIQEQGVYGTLAAIVYVEAEAGATLQPPYAALHLRGGVNCIWLKPTNRAGTSWTAYVTRGNTARACSRREGATPVLQLAVNHFTDPALRFEDYPPVARWGHVSGSTQPLIGVKCLNGWCEIGPGSPTPTAAGASRELRVRGWHDEQILGNADAAGVVRPSLSAMIVPEKDLDALTERDFDNVWVKVAVINFTTDPPINSKYARWGLRRGPNELYIQRYSRLGPVTWRAAVVPTSGPNAGRAHLWDKPVVRTVHHDAVVPGTARWRWMSGDDGVWVPCGQACCSADGGIH